MFSRTVALESGNKQQRRRRPSGELNRPMLYVFVSSSGVVLWMLPEG